MPRTTTRRDPKRAGRKPPYSPTKQSPPGKDSKMTPKADHGEDSYVGSSRMAGKVAIITGGDSGIGRAVAIAFAREGADIILSFLKTEQNDAEDTARWVKQAGRRIALIPGDVQKLKYCRSLVSKALKKFGHLDVVVNNAAFQRTYDKPSDIPEMEFDQTFRTNIYGTFFLSQASLDHLEEGGSIINTCSIQAFDPSPQLLAYAATKAALVNFTKGLAKAAAKQGIRVNGVAPGPVWTPLIPSTMPAKKVKEFGSDTAFERAAQPAEIAPIYVFLASQDATYVTGEIYGATGGQTPY
jgi:NAD(P)-dependent dehydrogenase (short-subunit alcohol dehydrogenase family)